MSLTINSNFFFLSDNHSLSVPGSQMVGEKKMGAKNAPTQLCSFSRLSGSLEQAMTTTTVQPRHSPQPLFQKWCTLPHSPPCLPTDQLRASKSCCVKRFISGGNTRKQ